jgi:cobaltochelatase CobN
MDPHRRTHLKGQILSETTGLAQDAGFTGEADHGLDQLDAYLCDSKEAQVREDGLHIIIFGQNPERRRPCARNLTIALLAWVARRDGAGANASLLRAALVAQDLELGVDPSALSRSRRTPWAWPRPDALKALTPSRIKE